jgi:hypothetical protein
MHGDLQQLLGSLEFLGPLYEHAPPAPEECSLFYVHIDERGNSVTLGFDTRRLPGNPPEEWQSARFNAVEFYLLFTEIEGLRISGWGADEARDVLVLRRGEEQCDVVLGSSASGMEFRASHVRLSRLRPYLASDSS